MPKQAPLAEAPSARVPPDSIDLSPVVRAPPPKDIDLSLRWPVPSPPPANGGRPTAGGGRRIEGALVDLEIRPDGSTAFERNVPITLGGTPRDQDAEDSRRLHQGGPYRMAELADQDFDGIQIGFNAELFELLFPGQQSTAEKRRLFKTTAALRAKLHDEACRERLKMSVFSLRQDLQNAWADVDTGLAEKKMLLFKRWDECAESGSEEMLLHAMAARATIIAFIREYLPAGAETEYTVTELEALNRARVSELEFVPYDTEAVQ